MRRNRQQGLVLVLTLILLVVLTLFVLSSTRMTTGNLRIVGNMQGKKTVDAVGQQAIEQTISAIAPFYAPLSVIVPANQPSGINVAIGNRVCIRQTVAPGYSAVAGVSPFDTFWDVSVTVDDTITKAKTEIHQGVRIRLPAGNCP